MPLALMTFRPALGPPRCPGRPLPAESPREDPLPEGGRTRAPARPAEREQLERRAQAGPQHGRSQARCPRLEGLHARHGLLVLQRACSLAPSDSGLTQLARLGLRRRLCVLSFGALALIAPQSFRRSSSHSASVSARMTDELADRPQHQRPGPAVHCKSSDGMIRPR